MILTRMYGLLCLQRRKQGPAFNPPSDVLVCSVGAGNDELLPHRLVVARMLWACRVSVSWRVA